MSYRQEVEALYEQLLAAWNDRDAKGFASLFSPAGAMVGFDGSQVDGSAVESHLTPVFADHPTAAYVWKVRDVQELAPGAALLRAIVGMVPPGGEDLDAEMNAVQSLVAVQHKDTWVIAVFQNTPARYHGRPELVEQHSAELRAVLRPQ
jgi:uncharacterized protein (TIGR02246 family)